MHKRVEIGSYKLVHPNNSNINKNQVDGEEDEKKQQQNSVEKEAKPTQKGVKRAENHCYQGGSAVVKKTVLKTETSAKVCGLGKKKALLSIGRRRPM